MRGSERIHIAQATLHTANYRARYRYRFIFWALGFAVPSVRVPGPRLVYCSFLWMWFGSPVGGAANDSRVSTATDLRELFLACHSASCVYRTAHVVVPVRAPAPRSPPPHATPGPEHRTGQSPASRDPQPHRTRRDRRDRGHGHSDQCGPDSDRTARWRLGGSRGRAPPPAPPPLASRPRGPTHPLKSRARAARGGARSVELEAR